MGPKYCQDCVGLGATGAASSGMIHLGGVDCRTGASWPACTGSRGPPRSGLCNVPGEQGRLIEPCALATQIGELLRALLESGRRINKARGHYE